MALTLDRPVIGTLGPEVPVNLIRSCGAMQVDLLDLLTHTPPPHDDLRLCARRALGAAADPECIEVLALLASPDCPVSAIVVSSTYQSHLWVHQVLQQWRRVDPQVPASMLIDLKHGGRPSTLRYNTTQLRSLRDRLQDRSDITATPPTTSTDSPVSPTGPQSATPLVLSGTRVRDPKLRQAMIDQGYRIVSEDHGEDFWHGIDFDGTDRSLTAAARAHARRPPLAPTASPAQRAQELLRLLRRQTHVRPGHVLFCTRTHDDAPLWDQAYAIRALDSSGLPWTWSTWDRDEADPPMEQLATLKASLPRQEARP